MRRWLIVAALAAFSACPPPPPKPDAGTYEHCLDSQANAVQQPGSELPCELLPPGFKR
jgi:hypothetical protein